MLHDVIKKFEMVDIHSGPIIVYIDIYINNYRLTQFRDCTDDECHEHFNHLWNRGRLHRSRAAVARYETAAR